MTFAPVVLPAIDEVAREAARARLDALTKPPGSLGQIEALAVRLAGITGDARCAFPRKTVFVFAADHGVTREGVSAFPAAVTAQMVANFLHGGAAINVLARRAGARVVVVDFGVFDPVRTPGLVDRRIGNGTANMAAGPAMTRGQALAAVSAGQKLAAEAIERGATIVATGEMGIGNTTAASAITAAITGRPAAAVTGRGTGISEAALAHKTEVVERALRVNAPDPADGIDVLAKVGGFEIGGLAGVIIGAAERRLPVVLDGFITGAAALIAEGLAPGITAFMVASHHSVERGHAAILERLSLRPLFDLDLRLGEGTGAALAMNLVDAAVAIRDEMATFAEAQVAGRSEA
ncbi:MAG: nicotinate-nucleotide--dimethylbenzimidazole phosphoribosyltransferase [Dehalococcoidia bacterium]|nr:nicotinate-nucleotide--dimethylbenzimidazole phosphoribosyltransferase [Dehalococcoidia bacterium]